MKCDASDCCCAKVGDLQQECGSKKLSSVIRSQFFLGFENFGSGVGCWKVEQTEGCGGFQSSFMFWCVRFGISL